MSPAADEITAQEESPMNGRSLNDSFVHASPVVALKSNAPAITSNNKNKKKHDAINFFDDNNRMTLDLTARIMEGLLHF